MAPETRNMDHVTPSPRLRARLSTAPYRTPHAHAFLPPRSPALARVLSPPSLCYCHPRSSLDRQLPLRSQAVLPVAPQNHRSRLKRRPRRLGRHQKRKTPLLFVARVVHRPWPSSLEVWTSSRFRRIIADHCWIGFRSGQFVRFCCYSLFVLDVPLSIF